MRLRRSHPRDVGLHTWLKDNNRRVFPPDGKTVELLATEALILETADPIRPPSPLDTNRSGSSAIQLAVFWPP
nr:MAG TPA: hypothetical protein [Caudoviricetes sp.]